MHGGDNRDVLRTFPDASFDSIVTDPPYALVSIVKRFGKAGAAAAKPEGMGGAYNRLGGGFMGKAWDTGETAFAVSFWQECLRVLKPGGHVLAFSHARTYHRMAVAIEDAGFEIRDQIGYVYGSGFPKSHNVSKNIGDARCSCQGQARAGAVLQRDLRSVRRADVSEAEDNKGKRGEVLQSVMPEQGAPAETLQRTATTTGRRKHRMERRGDVSQAARQLRQREIRAMPAGFGDDGTAGRVCNGAPPCDGAMGGASADTTGVCASQGSQPAEQQPEQLGTVAVQSDAQIGGAWPTCRRCEKPIIPDGIGTALKPAWEPICLARKPLIGSVAENVLELGVGGINIDGCRVDAPDGLTSGGAQGRMPQPEDWGSESRIIRSQPHALGRFPANLIHDGSDEVVACFPAEAGAFAPVKGTEPSSLAETGNVYRVRERVGTMHHGDSGSAARFFYTAKADAEDRIGSKHPTVKPVDLMQYLVRLVTPKGGMVLDPFAGTGTTGEAAWREGMDAILIEREADYLEDIARRMDLVTKPSKRAAVAATKNQIDDLGPLFGGK